MKIKTLVSLSVLSAALVACGGGDIEIDAQNNSVINNPTPTSAPSPTVTCASYTNGSGTTLTGQVTGNNCFYSESFVDFDNPLMTSVTLPNIGDGVHVFAGSIFVGQNFTSLADATAAGITRGGQGPTLRVEAGVTVALQNPEDFIAISRGSRIDAQGTMTAPITFTSEADIAGRASPEAVQTWGGMIINGFGFTNSCGYAAGWDRVDPNALTLEAGEECSNQIEGTEGDRALHYGGTVPNDNSGIMSYVVVKHAGFDIGAGNELNGITFGAVGSGTTLNNIEVYSNKDDGIEFFGGSADLTNYVAIYVQDDSIDIDEGYDGTITNALVIQGGGTDGGVKSGAHCVESDGSGSTRKATNIANGYVSRATIENLTCIISAKGPGVAGNSDPGAGINAEEGHELTLRNALVTTAYTSDATVDGSGTAIPAANTDFTNYCFQLEDPEDFVNAGNGTINIDTSIFACADISAARSRDSDFTITAGSEFGAITGQAFLEAQDNVVATGVADDGTTPPNAGNLTILNGYFSVPLNMMVVDGMAVSFTTSGISQVGAVLEANDWTAGWTFGLQESNRAQALWFE